MKISIIVPVYNVEAYLEKCLQSLVNQTINNYEILVVDDGSQDGSKNIIENFQKKYPDKIKAFYKENSGLSDTRNFALDRATGAFIGFVDGDDFVTETMYEELYQLAQKHHVEMALCNIQKVNEKGEVTRKLTQIPNLPEKINLEEHFSVFSDLGYFACNKIFKKELFKDKRFKKNVHFEDVQLIPQILLDCKNIAQTQTYHYQYLERENSISKKYTEKGLDLLSAVEDVEDYFRHSNYKTHKKELKNFQILEGFYSFLAYLAYVKDVEVYNKMSKSLSQFLHQRHITKKDILLYKRFDKNYLLSLPLKKKMFYLLYLLGAGGLVRKLI